LVVTIEKLSVGAAMDVEETFVQLENGNQKLKVEKDCYFILTVLFNHASKKFTNVIDYYKMITRSLSRRNCSCNTVAESYFKTLKVERIYGNKLI
jgi:hypothetical protein